MKTPWLRAVEWTRLDDALRLVVDYMHIAPDHAPDLLANAIRIGAVRVRVLPSVVYGWAAHAAEAPNEAGMQPTIVIGAPIVWHRSEIGGVPAQINEHDIDQAIEPATSLSPIALELAFDHWCQGLDAAPTKEDAEHWARERGIGVEAARKMQREKVQRRPGRPAKHYK